jgi:hypothetical protein
MSKQVISIGTSANDGTGDDLRTGASKINANFTEIYNTFGNGTTLNGAQGAPGAQGAAGAQGSQGPAGSGGAGESYWIQTAAGIHTLSNVGIGTTNPTSALTVKGNTTLESLSVSGVVTATSFVKSGGTSTQFLKADGSTDSGLYKPFVYNGFYDLVFGRNDRIVFDSDDTTIYKISIKGPESGLTRDTNYILPIDGDNGQVLTTNGSGVLGWSTNFYVKNNNVGIGTTNPTDRLTVQGGNVSIGGTVSVDGGVKLATNNATIVGTSGTAGEIKRIGGAPFFYDGSAWREFVLSSGTPVSVPADTEWDNVILRCTFDTDFTDSKFGVSPVKIGTGCSIVGAAVTIGTGAYRNDGTLGAGISFAYRSDYDFDGAWTIEFWIFHDSPVPNGEYRSLISVQNDTNNSGEWTFGLHNNGFNHYWYWSNENQVAEATLLVEANSTFNSNYLRKWIHYALVRESNNGSLHFYINGVETDYTKNNQIIDNNILNISGSGLYIGSGETYPTINGVVWNSTGSIDAIFDDLRITKDVRYTSIGISTYATFNPPTTALPTTGTLSSYVQPPGDKYGEITLGGSPTWRGTSGVTVTQQSSGNYRVSFASTYTNSNDYFVLTQAMDQGFASYVGVARSTTHVDFSINRQSNDAAVNTGSLSVQIKNHI